MARIYSNRFRLTVVEATTPAWRQGMAVNEWKQIPGTNISKIQTPTWITPKVRYITGPASIVSAWGGASIDARDSTVWMLANGGHADYAGNQAIKLKLSVNAPAWVEAAPPSADEFVRLDSRVYTDGRPTSAHAYYTQQFIEQRNRAMRFGSTSSAGPGGGAHFPNIISCDPDNGTYEADRTYPDAPTFFGPDTPICKDSATGNVYAWRSNMIYRWNQASATWSAAYGGRVTVNWGSIAIDTRRNQLFYCPGQLAPSLSAGATVDLRTFAVSSHSIPKISGKGWGMVFVQHPTEAEQDCFLLRHNWTGGAVFRINAVTLALDSLVTTGGGSIPASPNGIYNRFLYVPQFGGCVYIPRYDANVWFLRTH